MCVWFSVYLSSGWRVCLRLFKWTTYLHFKKHISQHDRMIYPPLSKAPSTHADLLRRFAQGTPTERIIAYVTSMCSFISLNWAKQTYYEVLDALRSKWIEVIEHGNTMHLAHTICSKEDICSSYIASEISDTNRKPLLFWEGLTLLTQHHWTT